MNIIIIGEDSQSLYELCKKSKNITHIYIATQNTATSNASIQYDDLENLISICQKLQIDIAVSVSNDINCDDLIKNFTTNKINLICVNDKWKKLETSSVVSKKLMDYYSIKHPATIKIPATFPVVMKTDNCLNPTKIIATSMTELITTKNILEKKINNPAFYIEEYLEGANYSMVSLWDKKSFLHFSIYEQLTEVQKERLDILKTKMNFMFSDENANFTGFIVTKLLWSKNDWYVTKFQTHLTSSDMQSVLQNLHSDFVQILTSAIYQNLGTICNEF